MSGVSTIHAGASLGLPAPWTDQTGTALLPPSSKGATPLLYIGLDAAKNSYDASALSIAFSSLPAWVAAVSNGALRAPFFFTNTGTFPLVGDGSYGSPSIGAATMNSAASVSVNSWAPNNLHAAAASAVCTEVMAYGEAYSAGRKGFILLHLFGQSMHAGGGGNSADSELSYLVACLNKIVDNGWVPVVIGPYANTSATSTTSAKNSAQLKLAYIVDKLNSLAAKYNSMILVNSHEIIGGKAGPYTDLFHVNFTPAASNGIRDLTLCQAMQNPSFYEGTTSRGLYGDPATPEVLSPLGTVALACGIWDAINTSEHAPQFRGYANPMTYGGDPLYWGTAADGSGNPRMTGSAAIGASGSVLAGTAPTGYSFGNQNTNSPTGGLTPAAMRDIYGRSFMRMSLSMTWGAGGSVYSTGASVVSTSGAYTNPPTEGQWLRSFARLKVHDTCNNIAGFNFWIDPYGATSTYGLRYANNQQTPWLSPLQGREILMESLPRPWKSDMSREVTNFALYTPDAALAVSGGVDIFEMGVRAIGEMA